MSGVLTHSPAHVLTQLLSDLGVGYLPGSSGTWALQFGKEPENPDTAITLYNTASRLNGRLHPTGVTQEHHGVLIRVRAAKNSTGWTKANAIANTLDTSTSLKTVTVSGTTYTVYAVTRTSGVLSLGKAPESNRNLFTINVVVAILQN
jgi:hypothetical protein